MKKIAFLYQVIKSFSNRLFKFGKHFQATLMLSGYDIVGNFLVAGD